jgi:putative ABC transport system substrate-binding protein
MPVTIGRRELLVALGGAAAAWPLAARAQQAATPVVAFINSGTPDAMSRYAAALSNSLSEAGYVEGQNVTVELHRRHPQGRQARRPAGLAVDQIRVRHQHADGKGTRHRGSQFAANCSRRGDRIDG